MNSSRLAPALAAAAFSIVMTAGCTTKSYVSQQTAPLIDHVNQLDTETARNTNDIKDVDQKTQQGIAQVNQSSQQAVTAAGAAQQQADQVKTQLDQTSNQIESLDSTLANLDEYRQVNTATVHFGFDKYLLTADAREALDTVAGGMQGNPHAIVEVKGYTDTTGPAGYNDGLSQRRANSVVQYLEAKGIAQHRIFLIGLGENQPAEPNTTLAGRQANRRVDLTILTNTLSTTTATGGPGGN